MAWTSVRYNLFCDGFVHSVLKKKKNNFAIVSNFSIGSRHKRYKIYIHHAKARKVFFS